MQLHAQAEEVRTPALRHIEAELTDVVPRDHSASSIESEDSRARRASPDWISALTRALASRLQTGVKFARHHPAAVTENGV